MVVVVVVLVLMGGSRWETDFQLIFHVAGRCDAWFDLPPFFCCFVILISHYVELWLTLMRLFCLPPFSLPVSCCDVTSDFWAFSRESAGEIFLGVLYLILDNCDSVDILQRLTPPLLFFTGSGDKTVRIWDVASQQQVAQLTGHTNYVTSVAFDGSGKYLASGEMTQAWSVLRHIFPPFSWMLGLCFAACWLLILMLVMMRTIWRRRRWCDCIWCGCFAWDVISCRLCVVVMVKCRRCDNVVCAMLIPLR